MSDKKIGDYLATYGKALIEHGFSIIPIPEGSKSPGYDGWQKTRSNVKLLTEWVNGSYRFAGAGILTKHTPAIDLDILDAEVAQQMEDWCLLNLGDAPIRVGRAPKRLLVYKTDEPFRKMKSGKYRDEWGDEHEIEILGDGQQFVGYAFHKDTGLPYEWTTEKHPANTSVNELETITPEHARSLLKYFIATAKKLGWKQVTSPMWGNVSSAAGEEHDVFSEMENTIDLPSDELRKRLLLIPSSEDYERWTQIGMALYHQFSGEDEGLALWHEWSETADNYSAEELEKKWVSFNIENKKRAPITARLIMKLSNEAMTTLAAKTVADLRADFFAAADTAEWKAVCEKVRKAEIDGIARAEITEVARKQYFEITGTRLPLPEIRKALAYAAVVSDKIPHWAEDWIYDSMDDRFLHLGTKITMTQQAFNTTYSRNALTKSDIIEGKSKPSASPVELAVNVYQIATVYGSMYAPGRDDVFKYNGVMVANTYAEKQVPEIPDEYRAIDKRAIQRIKDHIKHLIEDPREQRIFLDWLAWVVQNPGKRVNWALLLQGVEGDGKSFFAFLIKTVMGMANVRMMNANVLEGAFTGWAHGQCVAVIEEPRLHGHNKYDIINRIKPYITNETVEIHPKGRDPYNVDNTTNYFLPTNFRDALPINENDRRYCVMFSRWQSRAELIEFNLENPTYYADLYSTIRDCAGGLRRWLLEHEVSDDFPAGGDAPVTKAHAYMVDASTHDMIRGLNEVIAEGLYADISKDIVNVTMLSDALIGRNVDMPQTSAISRTMENAGYVSLGQIKIDNAVARYWSKVPHLFRIKGQTDNSKVRENIKKRKLEIETEEL
jgi:hypothetical protein